MIITVAVGLVTETFMDVFTISVHFLWIITNTKKKCDKNELFFITYLCATGELWHFLFYLL